MVYPHSKCVNYATRTCILPFVCPVIRNLRGLEPILLEASHSCTQYEVMLLPSTERIVQILKKRIKLPAQYKYKKQTSKITQQILKSSNSRLQSGLCLAWSMGGGGGGGGARSRK